MALGICALIAESVIKLQLYTIFQFHDDDMLDMLVGANVFFKIRAVAIRLGSAWRMNGKRCLRGFMLFLKGVVGARHSNVSEVLSILFSLENLQLVLSWELVCGE